METEDSRIVPIPLHRNLVQSHASLTIGKMVLVVTLLLLKKYLVTEPSKRPNPDTVHSIFNTIPEARVQKVLGGVIIRFRDIFIWATTQPLRPAR